MKTSITFTLKVWQTAVFLAPVLIVISGILNGTPLSESLFILLPGIVLGLVFSIPSAVIFGLTVYFMADSLMSDELKKVTLSVAGVALTMLSFFLFDRGRIQDVTDYYYFAAFASVILAGIWFYRFEPATSNNDAGASFTDNQASLLR